MTKRDVLSLALKILGVYSIIFALRFIPNFILWMSMLGSQSSSSPAPIWTLISFGFPIFLSLRIAYILLRRGDSIAQKLIKDDKDIPSLSHMDWESLFFILFLRITGVVFMLRSLPQLSNYLIRLGLLSETQRPVFTNNIGSLISAIVLLILGVYLLFGAKRFARFILKDKKPAEALPKSGKNENLL